MCKKINLRKLTLVFGSCLFLVSCTQKNSPGDSFIRVGVSADFAPMCFIENKELKGFDIDLMKAIASKMDRDIKWNDIPFETTIPELVTGKIDLAIGGISPTEERGKKVLFSHKYLNGASIVAIINKGSPALSTKDWSGFRSIVCQGYTTSDDFATNELGLRPLRLQNLIDCMLALRAGQGDVLIAPMNAIALLIAQDREQWQVLELKNDANEGSVCLISKQNSELQPLVNQAIDELIAEGTIEKLKAKWNIHD